MKTVFQRFNIILVILITLFSLSCKKDNNPVTPPIDPIVVSPDVKILSDSLEQRLITLGVNQDTLIFQGLVTSLKQNDIIISDVGVGILRRIKSINQVGNQTFVFTDTASIAEALPTATFSDSFDISGYMIQSIDYNVPGIRFKKNTSPNELSFTFENAVLYKVGSQEITASGGITIKMKPKLEFKTKDGKLTKLSFSVEPTGIIELNFNVPLEIPVIKPTPKLLFTIRTSPQIFLIGGIPVVITNEIPIYCGLEGNVKVNLSTGIKNTTSLLLGVTYENGQISWQKKFNNQFTFTPPTLSGEASLQVFLQPKLEIKLYGVAGPSINIKGYGEGVGEISANTITGVTELKGTIYGGIEAGVGVIIKIFDIRLASFDSPSLVTYRLKVKEWTQTYTAPTVTTTSITSITSTSASGGGNVTSQGSSSVTARGVCWSTSENPTIAGSKTVDGSGTGSFTSSITGLSASTMYYVRAYATNGAGTSYGSQVSFTTSTSSQLLIVKGTVGSTSQSIYSMNPDGSNITLIRSNTMTSSHPVWSSDKSKIVYSSNNSTTSKRELFLMNSDGTNNIQITNDNPQYGNNAPIFRNASKIWYANAQSTGWTEITEINYDGTGKIALTNFYAQGKSGDWVNINYNATKLCYYKQTSSWSPDGEIYTSNIDFSGEVRLTNNSMNDNFPKFSPSGNKIVFTRETAALSGISNVFVMNSDGTGATQLTSFTTTGQVCSTPIWSPDGQKITYTVYDGTQNDIWMMNADGTSKLNITNTSGYNEITSDWK